MRQVPTALRTLFFAILFDQLSLSTMFPVLAFVFFDTASTLFSPDTSYATRSMLYGVCISLANFSSIIAAVLLGILSDKYGRKRILLIAMLCPLVCAIFSVWGILLGIIWIFLLGKLISGSNTRSIAGPVAQAIVGDVGTADHKLAQMGYLQFIISLGAFIGPLLGGYLAKSFHFSTFNFSLPFLLAIIFAMSSCVIAFFYFKETYKSNNNLIINFKDTARLLLNPSVLQLSLYLLFMQISWSTYYQFIPPLLKNEFNFNAIQVGLFVGLMALWLAIASTIGIILLKKLNNHYKIILLGSYLISLGFVAVCLASKFPGIVLAKPLLWFSNVLIPVGDVIGYCAITTLYSNAVSIHDQGKVMGLGFIIVAIVWTLTALLGGVLSSFNVALPILVAPVGIVLLLCTWRYKHDSLSRCR